MVGRAHLDVPVLPDEQLRRELHSSAEVPVRAAPHRLVYVPRLLACSGVALLLWLANGAATLLDVTLCAALLMYPHIALLLRRLDGAPHWTLQYLEGALAGVAMASLEFALLPAMTALMLVVTSHVVLGGVLIGARSAAFAALTAVAMQIGLGVPFDPWGDTWAAAASVVLLPAYVTLIAMLAFRQSRRLRLSQREVSAHNAVLKSHSERLGRYLSPQVSAAVGGSQRAEPGRRRYLSVFFSDIEGFTTIAESLEPEVLSRLLNEYLARMTEVALQHGGTVDKFIGDAVMVFFGDPDSAGREADAQRCCAMALGMQAEVAKLCADWQHEAGAELRVRMGVASGWCSVGSFGCEHRMDYTAVGNVVNLASRLEGQAKPGQVLVSSATAELVQGSFGCRVRAPMMVAGFSRPVTSFALQACGAAPLRNWRVPGVALTLDTEALVPREAAAVLQQALQSLADMERSAFR